jgi:hypothetical protein
MKGARAQIKRGGGTKWLEKFAVYRRGQGQGPETAGRPIVKIGDEKRGTGSIKILRDEHTSMRSLILHIGFRGSLGAALTRRFDVLWLLTLLHFILLFTAIKVNSLVLREPTA